MSPGPGGTGVGPDVTPGFVASWALSFHRDPSGRLDDDPVLVVGSDTYDGTVTATLPDDLTGGTYQAVVEGLTDADYAVVRHAMGDRLAARLYLWWKDSPAGALGLLASWTGFTDPLGAITPTPPAFSMVAELRVDTVSRRAGDRRYEAVFTMRERAFARLGEVPVAGQCFTDLPAVLRSFSQTSGVTITGYGLDSVHQKDNDPAFASVAPGTALEALTAEGGVVSQVRDGLRAFGPSVAVVRDGTLHVGHWLGGPFATRGLDDPSGLVKVERGAERARDRKAGAAPPGAPHSRPGVTLTCLGRPDIKPGDTVHVQLPPDDFPSLQPGFGGGLLTSATGIVTGGYDAADPPARDCLVGTVAHTISRRAGFTTTIQAVVLASEHDDGWDAVDPNAPPATAPTGREPARGTRPASPASATALAMQDVARAASARPGNVVALVTSHRESTHDDDPPRHSSEVRYANGGLDGKPAAAQRIEIESVPTGVAREVPLLSPFAWGPYGLALPRYPGTRVLLAPGPGGSNDLIDMGALWDRGDGPNARAGDYWLTLPVDVADSTTLGSSNGVAPDGPAIHDLTDAAGTRVIETKQFVLRVTDEPTDCTSRPEPGEHADAGAVVIETKSGNGAAQIVLKADGTITVTGTSITFDTQGQGDITLRAANVKVQVDGTMDVS